jgi:hypothetical protein
MASVIETCNLALSHLGEAANISDLNEGSANADNCRRFYPIARDLVLSVRAWSFNTVRSAPPIYSAVPPSTWQFAYAVPAKCLRVIAVLMPGAADECGQPFIMETAEDGTIVVLTNVESAIVRYTTRIEDPNKISPLAMDAICWLLTSYIAGPVLKGEAGIAAGRAAYQNYIGQLAIADGIDANQQHSSQTAMSATIAARYGCAEFSNQYPFPRGY